MNINFLKFNEHTQTEEFLDMLYANNILPIITKPTRLTDHTATLIGHICTNCLQNFTAGILACENIRFSSLFAAGDETSPSTKSEEKRMFSQATGILTVDITDHLPIFC